MISMPRDSSQATQHCTIFFGSFRQPWMMALASASRKDSSMWSSLPAAHPISRTSFITLSTTGETAVTSAARMSSKRKVRSLLSNSQRGMASPDIHSSPGAGGNDRAPAQTAGGLLLEVRQAEHQLEQLGALRRSVPTAVERQRPQGKIGVRQQPI